MTPEAFIELSKDNKLTEQFERRHTLTDSATSSESQAVRPEQRLIPARRQNERLQRWLDRFTPDMPEDKILRHPMALNLEMAGCVSFGAIER